MASAAASVVTCWHAVAMSDHLDACRLLDDDRCPYIFSSFREAKQIEHQSTSKQNSSVKPNNRNYMKLPSHRSAPSCSCPLCCLNLPLASLHQCLSGGDSTESIWKSQSKIMENQQKSASYGIIFGQYSPKISSECMIIPGLPNLRVFHYIGTAIFFYYSNLLKHPKPAWLIHAYIIAWYRMSLPFIAIACRRLLQISQV